MNIQSRRNQLQQEPEDECLQQVEGQLAELRERERNNPGLPERIEIGIRLMEQDGDCAGVTGRSRENGATQIKGCYYICDMKKREVFWIHSVDPDIFWEDSQHNPRIVGEGHLRG